MFTFSRKKEDSKQLTTSFTPEQVLKLVELQARIEKLEQNIISIRGFINKKFYTTEREEESNILPPMWRH